MQFIPLILILCFNVLISYLNARAVAPVWAERRHMGWGLWLVLWSAVIQSAVGFSMPILLGEVGILYVMHLVPVALLKLSVHIWYVAVIIPVIGTGLVLTANSWIEAWKRRDLASGATAAWNTYASASNVADAASTLPRAFSAIGDAFDSDDEGGAYLFLAIMLAAIALCSGAFITYAVLDAYKVPALRKA